MLLVCPRRRLSEPLSVSLISLLPGQFCHKAVHICTELQGWYNSTVTYCNCQHASCKFDAVTCMTLPLPVSKSSSSDAQTHQEAAASQSRPAVISDQLRLEDCLKVGDERLSSAHCSTCLLSFVLEFWSCAAHMALCLRPCLYFKLCLHPFSAALLPFTPPLHLRWHGKAGGLLALFPALSKVQKCPVYLVRQGCLPKLPLLLSSIIGVTHDNA